MKEKSDIVYDTTVVIAEDELLVRIGIKSSVDWEKNGFKQQTAMKPYRW